MPDVLYNNTIVRKNQWLMRNVLNKCSRSWYFCLLRFYCVTNTRSIDLIIDLFWIIATFIIYWPFTKIGNMIFTDIIIICSFCVCVFHPQFSMLCPCLLAVLQPFHYGCRPPIGFRDSKLSARCRPPIGFIDSRRSATPCKETIGIIFINLMKT